MNGPAWTIVGRGQTGLRDVWVTVRKRGGRLVRLTMPLTIATAEHEHDMIEHAIAALPDLPGPNVY